MEFSIDTHKMEVMPKPEDSTIKIGKVPTGETSFL
jgi:hypothetical protein